MPWTMIWSIRAIGNEAGQPKPLTAAPCVERIWEVTPLGGTVVHRAVQITEQHLPIQRLAGDGLAQRTALASLRP